MNKAEFIEAIKLVVLKGSIESTIKTLLSPPGRKPDEKLVELSNWFNNLSNENKEMVLLVIERSVKTSVFEFLCVLDAVTQIEKTFDKGTLKLYFEKDGITVLLNDFEQEFLHDLL